MMHRKARRQSIAALFAAGLVAATCTGVAAGGHGGGDYPTGYETWHWTPSVPTSWHQALINGVLVWDNVPNQCHDFVRVAWANGQIPHWPNYIDGDGPFVAITTNHTNIQYDSGETWHTNISESPGPDELDLWSIAAHENGHTLTLGHSSNDLDTMGETYDYGNWHWRTLELNDRQRIQALYPYIHC
jgi:Matrixin